MTFRLKHELVLLNLITIILFLVIFFLQNSILRVILGIPFILFSPGYAFTAALYTKKFTLSGTERLMWSVGFSIAFVSLLSLVMNYTPIGIRLYPIAITIMVFIFITSSIALYRRHQLPEYERFSISITLSPPWGGKSTPDKVLSVLLAVAILVTVGVIYYRITNPNENTKFTEVYILNSKGVSTDYPNSVTIGQNVAVIIVIRNSEYREVTYRLEVTLNDIVQNSIEPITLKQGEIWQNEVIFTPDRVGENQEVKFVVYEGGDAKPVVTPLHLWINVIEP